MTLLDLLLLGLAAAATLAALYQRSRARRANAGFDEAMALLEAANAGWGAANSALLDLAAAMREGEATLNAARTILEAARRSQPLPPLAPPHDERLN